MSSAAPTGRDYDDCRKRNKTATSPPLTIETTVVCYTGTLTFDLVVEILFRVPVKSLMQLRCVCKSWNSLISDPKFAKKHLSWSRKQLNRHHVLLLRRDSEAGIEFLVGDTQLPSFFNSTSSTTSIPGTRLRFPRLRYPTLNHPNLDDTLVASCDGILCFSIGSVYDNSVMLWNPSIRKFKILPPFEYQSPCPSGYRSPSRSIIYGFGYDCLNDTYKVLADDLEHFGETMIYTVGNDTWKIVEDFPSYLLKKGDKSSGRFVCGTINWLAFVPSDSGSDSTSDSTSDSSSDSTSSCIILSFDLGNESSQMFLLPDCGDVCDLTLGVLRDSLCVLAHTDTLVIHVWLMKDYGSEDSWTKLFVVPYKELIGCEEPASAYPLYISEEDQLLLDFGVELAVYNSRDGTGKTPEVQSIFGGYCDWFHNHVYIESLIAPWA